MKDTKAINKSKTLPLFSSLADLQVDLMQAFEFRFHFSFSQLKQASEWLIDFDTWGNETYLNDLASWMDDLELRRSLQSNQKRSQLFQKLSDMHSDSVKVPRLYSDDVIKEFKPKFRFEDFKMEHNRIRLCPAASPKTMICCNLKTINVVDNCSLGCSYCVLQNHYEEAVIKVPTNLADILGEIEVKPDKRYRVGTGEYSDSLLWGNRNGILDALMDFARKHPNIILELKTKSPNIKYLLETDLPSNLCVSWSMNPQLIIDHEERGTASFRQRINSARKLSDKGIKVGFHFHPMMYFQGWEQAYQSAISEVVNHFNPSEVLWVSFGVVTLMKGFAQEFRSKYKHSRLLQMPMEETPEGKLTYPYSIRRDLYVHALKALSPWRGGVFHYLCMEHQEIWDEVMPYTYKSVPEFDEAFNDSAFAKLN